MPDQLIVAAVRERDKAARRLKESESNVEAAIALALKEKRITPKEATQIRARFRGK